MSNLTKELNTFLKDYEYATNSHNFNNVEKLLSSNAIYWFSDGSFQGIAQIKKAFEKTWTSIKDESYSLSNIKWLCISDNIAIFVYTFHWKGIVSGIAKEGTGRGTNVIEKIDGSWKMRHEHLSSS